MLPGSSWLLYFTVATVMAVCSIALLVLNSLRLRGGGSGFRCLSDSSPFGTCMSDSWSMLLLLLLLLLLLESRQRSTPGFPCLPGLHIYGQYSISNLQPYRRGGIESMIPRYILG